ncbi:hypothetical protein FisN_10Hh121 [Fistulifera solaris]|uniref:Uncharacterized protein n=1 Tax=Fistulifera solaris TaxID=1519565 RepID=A0A1Z5JXQ3_FISSO|nr:hypothetical protein FisN_10Hh121 [Fistulifera solaris]|eukprot:GAX18666.1 hypothetical protein FisN_10Hh121 [Fistulifera solaris]
MVTLFWATTTAQTLVPDEFFFEYRFFANTAGEANATDAPLAVMLKSLQNHLNEYIASFENAAVVIDSIDYFSRAPCSEEDFELEYSDCGTYRSNVVLNLASEYDPVVVKQVLTREIQTFVEDSYANETNNQVDTLYDYPKWVQTTVYMELVGVSTPMDDDEMFLFLQEFEDGFRPQMEEDNYDWVKNEILYQEIMDNREEFNVQERNVINKVKLMPKATCSGDSCNDENFYNYLVVNLDAFTGEFLGRLQGVSPNGADDYYTDIIQIIVRNDQLEIPELPPEENLDPTASQAGDDKDIPFWLWILALLAVITVVVTLIYVCILSPRRKAAEQKDDENGYERPSHHSMNPDDPASPETPI